MDSERTPPSADLGQRRQQLLALLAAIEQEQAAAQADRASWLGWQERLKQGLDYWAMRGEVLTQLSLLLPSEPLSEPVEAFLQAMIKMREDIAHDHLLLDDLMPRLFRAESLLNEKLAMLDQLVTGLEDVRQDLLALYDQTKGEPECR